MDREKFRELMSKDIFPWLPSFPLPRIRTGGRRWRHFFLSQMASYVDAGLSLTDAVEACIADYPRRFRYSLRKIKQGLEEGCTLSEALSRQSQLVFPKAFRAIIETGERSGTLADCLKTLDSRQEDALTLKMKIAGAIAYPVLVLFLCFMITAFLLIKVVPTFAEIIHDLGGALPPPTQTIVDLSHAFMSASIVLLGLMAFAFPLLFIFLALRREVDLFGRIFVRIPGVGDMARRYDLLYFSTMMALLMESGLPAPEALSLCGTEAFYPPLRDAADKVSADIWKGESLGEAVARQGAFPPTFTWLVSVGEQSGSLTESFRALADFERTRIERTLVMFRRFFQPSVLILLSFAVGFVVVSMWLPIFQISDLI
jgi:type II secretory pathway component PulF